MMRLGFGVRPTVNYLAGLYPKDHIDHIKAIVQLASESCAAATLYRNMPPDQRPSVSDIPSLPE
jgi:hypothetical protein